MPYKHHIISQIFHWLMALLMIALFITVTFMQHLLPQFFPPKPIHELIGFLILIFTILRIINRWLNPAPPYSNNVHLIQRIIARISEIAIYTLLILQSLTGWALASSSHSRTRIFGSFRLPPISPNNATLHRRLHQIHPVLGWIFLACIAIHTIAIIIHELVLHDEIFQRMIFSRKHKKSE